jgi:hypothetical protein
MFAWLISHQSTVLFSQNKPATSNQPTIPFSQNKPAPAISHQSNEQVVAYEARSTDCREDLQLPAGIVGLGELLSHEMAKGGRKCGAGGSQTWQEVGD